ncbi:MAG: sugar transferase [Oscillospiraceae bacterium]|nr:sugar transferase [Oscillospiraceae bacterium]
MSLQANDTTQKTTEIKSKPVYDFFKRLFDIISSLMVSIVLLVPMLIVAVIIISKDGWSPFYKQMRVGRNKKMIGVFKFRSMKNNADRLEEMLPPDKLEEYRREYKITDDPRLIGYKKAGDGIKCFGAKLRKTSFDEVPQILINILILGNMSVVGPRPILPDELEENYTPEQQKLLLSVKPGLTGYWQAYARNKAGYGTGERQSMEMFYIENRSFFLDMKIIFKTVSAVFADVKSL